MKNFTRVAFLFACLGFLVSCAGSRGPTMREQGALGGAALGTGLGAIVGNQSGHSGQGALIGGAAGLLAGALIGNQMQNTEDNLNQRDDAIRRQQEQLEENRRLISELRAKGADVRETNRGVVVNLPDVLFDFNKASLTPRALDTVNDIASSVRNVKGRDVLVEGHADAVGSEEYNQRLSEDRANSVADALVHSGVNGRQLLVRGYGKTRPIASNKTSSGRARNRRVEVIVANR